VPDGNLRKVRRVLSLGKHHLRHPAPDGPPEVEAGKVPYTLHTEPFDLLRCLIERNLAIFVPF
jgi:hypothetical protein